MVKKAVFRECHCWMLFGIHTNRLLILLFLLFYYLSLSPGCSKKTSPTTESIGPENPSVPKQTLISITKGELLYDFGYVKPNEKREVDFTIQNPTGNEIQIQRVRSECKCMYAPNPPTKILSNDNTPLKLVFIAPRKPQLYDKKLILQTTNRQYPILALRIKADVDRPLVCRPETIDIGELNPKEDSEISVTISNRGRNPVRPIYATSSVDGFIAQIPRAEIPPDGDLVIPLKIHLNDGTQERKDALVNIHTDLPSQPQIGVRIQYSVAALSN